MDEWAANWLKEQREKGSKGLEIKRIGSSYYVYRSTTVWDKELKKRKKRSKYIGRLDEHKGLQEKESMLIPTAERVVKQYGNAVLLNRAMSEMLDQLRSAFPEDWKEIYALSMVRILGDVPLRRVQNAWDKLYNISGTKPDLSTKALAQMLRRVGNDKKAQAKVFNGMCVAGDEVVYGLSAYFTRSEQTDLIDRGPDQSRLMQRINLAMIFSVDTGAPTMVRTISSPVGELGPMRKLLDEIGGEGMTLVLERDSFTEDVVALLLQKKASFVLPVDRCSDLYDLDIPLSRHFFHDKHLIKCGKRRHRNMFLYLFQDVQLKMEEEMTLYRMLDENRLAAKSVMDRSHIAGCIMLASDKDVAEEEIYRLHRRRDAVDRLFAEYRKTMGHDREFLVDRETMDGHMFVAFLSIWAYTRIEAMLSAGSMSGVTPLEALDELSRTYWIQYEGGGQLADVPRIAKDLGKSLGFDVFAK
jgi:transposase